jgi:hypothetical protein
LLDVELAQPLVHQPVLFDLVAASGFFEDRIEGLPHERRRGRG